MPPLSPTLRRPKSERLFSLPANAGSGISTFNQLAQITPGGVNSPFRSFHEVGEDTLVFSRGRGSQIWDLDGNVYLDYLGAWGPAILGHAHPAVVKAAQEAVADGAVLGLSTRWELEMAQLVRQAFPSMEMMRFVNSGAEAVDAAIRAARGFTRRSLIVRFEGGYHGHGDSVVWGYGPEENHSPEECGVPKGLAQETLTVPFNNPEALEKIFAKHKRKIAALLVEPVTGSMGVILPHPQFLQQCRDLAHSAGAVLIFDEVLTGFRIAFGGAQERFRVKADLTCLGKILGGGFPAGGYGGKKEIMQRVSPLGPVYQAGTFSGNPITMRAGIAALRTLQRAGFYPALEKKTSLLLDGFQKLAHQYGIDIQTPHAGSLFSILFCKKPIHNYRDSLTVNQAMYRKFFSFMLHHGILFPPSATDAAVISQAHSLKDIALTLQTFEKACQVLARH